MREKKKEANRMHFITFMIMLNDEKMKKKHEMKKRKLIKWKSWYTCRVWEGSRPSKHPSVSWVGSRMCDREEFSKHIDPPPPAVGCCPRVWPHSPLLSHPALPYNTTVYTSTRLGEHTWALLFTMQPCLHCSNQAFPRKKKKQKNKPW